jgi:hypothetical protein
MARDIIGVIGSLIVVFLLLDAFFLGWVIVETPIMQEMAAATGQILLPGFSEIN